MLNRVKFHIRELKLSVRMDYHLFNTYENDKIQQKIEELEHFL